MSARPASPGTAQALAAQAAAPPPAALSSTLPAKAMAAAPTTPLQVSASDPAVVGQQPSSSQQQASASSGQRSSPLLLPVMLVRLVEKGGCAKLRQALALGADHNAADEQRVSLLMHAIGNRRTDVPRLLLDTGRCRIEDRDMRGFTALMYAAFCGCLELVQLLISCGGVVESHD